ncbi:MAG: glycogen synthase [Acidobacteriota bacterium]
MRICIAASEVTPFAKTGGLADVAAALPRYLAGAGHDVRLFLPFHSRIDLGDAPVHRVDFLTDVPIRLGAHGFRYSVFTTPLPESNLWVYLIDCPALFHRPSLYGDGPDEHLRFAFFSRAVIESCQRMGWAPEILHANDWHTGLIPLYLKALYGWDRLFDHTRTLLTIHNIAYQGVFSAEVLDDLGLGSEARRLHQDDLHAGRIGYLKTGILWADALSTVSRTHAQEIQTEAYGFGLHGLLRARSDRLVGIVNGVDYGDWDPAADPYLPHPYTADDLSGKEKNKQSLLEGLGMEYRQGRPLLGLVSRLTHQKGLDLTFNALSEQLAAGRVQLVALGTGERRLEKRFQALQGRFPGQACFIRAYSEEIAHRIEAAADIFLMPSRYEPCGLNQMYSLRYGTPPIVRKTGGLADTVRPWNPGSGEGTGFVFEHADEQGFHWALHLALEAYGRPESWRRIQRAGMAEDFSWRRQGKIYEELYRRLAG